MGAISILFENDGRRQHTRSPQSVLIRPRRTARDPGRGTLPCEAFVGIVDVAEAVAAGDVGRDGQLVLACGDHADIGQIGRISDHAPLLPVQLHRVDGGGVVRHLYQGRPISGRVHGDAVGDGAAVEGKPLVGQIREAHGLGQIRHGQETARHADTEAAQQVHGLAVGAHREGNGDGQGVDTLTERRQSHLLNGQIYVVTLGLCGDGLAVPLDGGDVGILQRDIGISVVNVAVYRELQRHGMLGGLVLHDPRLCLARGEAQTAADGRVNAQDLLGGVQCLIIEGVAGHIQKQDVGLGQGVGHRHGDLGYGSGGVGLSPGGVAVGHALDANGGGSGSGHRLVAAVLLGVAEVEESRIVVEQAHDDVGLAALVAVADGPHLTRNGVPQLGLVLALHVDVDALLTGHVLVVGLVCLGDEQPQTVGVTADLVDQIAGIAAVEAADLHGAVLVQRVQQSASVEADLDGLVKECLAARRGLGVLVLGGVTHEHQLTAGGSEGLQTLQGSGAQGLALGNHHHVVGHLAHGQRRSAHGALNGEGRLADEVEVDVAPQEPVGDVLEVAVQLVADELGLLVGTPMEPVALHGMHDRHLDQGLASGQSGVHAAEVVFNIGIFLVPGGLVGDGGGVVPLGGTLHGYPGQMLDTDGDAQSGLPVAVELVASEVEVPARDAVQLAHHAGTAVLVDSRLALLGGGELKAGAEHINTGDAEASVGAHTVADGGGLGVEGGLLHHVARQLDAVSLAPIAAVVGEGLGESLGDVIVVVVAGQGDLTVGKIPQKLGQVVYQRLPVGGLEGVLKVVGPGQMDVLLAVGKGQSPLTHELRLVGEDGGDGLTELVADGSEVSLVGHLDEAVDGLLVQGVHVGLVIVPRAVTRDLPPDRPESTLNGLPLGHLTVGLQALVLPQHHVEAGNEEGVITDLVVLVTGKGEVSLAELVVLGDVSAAKARGPLVLVVEPRQHLVLLGVVGAGLDQTHEAVGEVGGGHTVAAMHMEAAQAHLLEYVDLTAQLVLLQVTVPCPKGGAAILGGGVLEQLSVQSGGISVLVVDHTDSFPP